MNQSNRSKTALITGASTGIGAEFARQLAARGYTLVITARRENLLHQLAEEISSSNNVNIQVIPADLSKSSDLESLLDLMKNLPQVDLLVHSAGFGTVGMFHQVVPEKELSMLNVHMVAPVMLSRAALPGMLSRRQGGIIIVSSIAGLIPIRNVLYHSTKSFQIHFAEILQAELRGSGVNVQALCPGYTLSGFHDTPEYTQFTRRSVPRFLWMSSQQVVTESLKSLPNGRLYCFPGTFNKIAGNFSRISLVSGLIKYFGRLIVYRQKAL